MSGVSGAVGVVGQGVTGEPGAHDLAPLPVRHEWCATNDHPGHTFNPWLARTWCLCGAVARDGDDVVMPKPTSCGGPLATCNHPLTPAASLSPATNPDAPSVDSGRGTQSKWPGGGNPPGRDHTNERKA